MSLYEIAIDPATYKYIRKNLEAGVSEAVASRG